MKNCSFFKGHNWSKWEEYSRGSVNRSRDDKKVGTYIIQERECQDCGKKQIHYEEASI